MIAAVNGAASGLGADSAEPGPAGLKAIAGRINRLASIFAAGLQKAGFKLASATGSRFFDSFDIATRAQTEGIALAAVVEQSDLAQLFDAGVERVGRDAAHAVLQ